MTEALHLNLFLKLFVGKKKKLKKNDLRFFKKYPHGKKNIDVFKIFFLVLKNKTTTKMVEKTFDVVKLLLNLNVLKEEKH